MSKINKQLALCLMEFSKTTNGFYKDDNNKIVVCNRSNMSNTPSLSHNTVSKYKELGYNFYDSKGRRINI